MRNNLWYKGIALVLTVSALTASLCGCSDETLPNRVDKANDLMASVQKSESAPVYDFNNETDKPENYDSYINKNGALALNLLKAENYATENTAVAPVAVSLSLSALENGTSGDTLKQMKKVLGKSTYSTDTINECASYLTQRMSFFNNEDIGVFNVNSMWITDKETAKRGFLQKYDNYYNIFAYKIDFTDEKANTLISNLIKDNSMDLIPTNAVSVNSYYKLYLDSSTVVSDNWLYGYEDADVSSGKFTAQNGKAVDASYITSTERTFTVENAQGFVKDLKNTPCKLLCVMPNEDVTLEKYISELTTENLLNLANSASPTSFANVSIPEFSINSNTSIKESLKSIGIEDIFTSNADLLKAFTNNIYVNDYTQNITITVNKNGISTESVQEEETKNKHMSETALKINRPFLYAIIDNESYAPIIIGTVNNPNN